MRLTSPKTENSVRKIPFFGETREVLEKQFEKVKRKREDLGKRWRQPEEYGNLVFLTSMGSPIGRYSIESDMRYVTQQINDVLKRKRYILEAYLKILNGYIHMRYVIRLLQDALKKE